MAIKFPKPKPTRKKSSRKVRDLTAKRDPKGGGQKRESSSLDMNTQRGTAAKRNLN
jgi:hypothetical protein